MNIRIAMMDCLITTGGYDNNDDDISKQHSSLVYDCCHVEHRGLTGLVTSQCRD